MAITALEICARALVNLGARPISSFEASGDIPATLKIVYPQIRAGLCAKYPWECMKKREYLTRESGDPGGYQYQFIMPSDLKGAPGALFTSANATRSTSDFEVRQRRIVCNFPEVWLEYSIEAQEDQWPAWFVDLMAAAICAEVAFMVTDQQSTQDAWQSKAYGSPSENGFGGLLGQCMTLDAQGSGNIGLVDDAFVNARFGATYPGDYIK